MPYTVENKTPRSTARSAIGNALKNFERRTTPDYDIVSSSTVATIEEARVAAQHVVTIGMDNFGDDRQALIDYGWTTAENKALDMPETGGIIIMPDGYLVVVQFCSYGELWKMLTGSKRNQPVDTSDIIDACNAAAVGIEQS